MFITKGMSERTQRRLLCEGVSAAMVPQEAALVLLRCQALEAELMKPPKSEMCRGRQAPLPGCPSGLAVTPDEHYCWLLRNDLALF